MISRLSPVFLLLAASVFFGQDLPSLSQIVEQFGGMYSLTFKNVGNSPLAAFIVVGSKMMPGSKRDVVSTFDRVMNPRDATSGKDLNPGESETFRFDPKLKSGESFDARVVAAIYEDGKMEGSEVP